MSGRTGVVQLHRTVTVNPPAANTLLDGELAIMQAGQMQLWVGVPTTIDPTGRKLLYNQAAAVAGVTSFNTRAGAVVLNATDVDTATGLLRTGGTMTGYIVTNANATLPLHLVPLQQMQAADNLLQQQIDLLAEDMYFVGGINVATNVGNYTVASGITDGPLPAPVAAYKGYYVIVTTGGAPPAGNIPPGTYQPADWIVCDGAQWVHLTMGLQVMTAPMVAMSPVIGAMGANVQTSLQWLYTNKLNLAGGTMTGFIVLHANPTAAMHAAPKQYVDAFRPPAGTVTVAVDGTSILGTGLTATPLRVGIVNGGVW